MNFEKLTAYLDSLGTAYGIPQTDVIVTKDHETIYRHMTGFSDVEKTKPTTNEDYYWFFSCTKVVTQIAVMQLIEQKKIHLYDPLYLYLPEYECMTVCDKDYMNTGFAGITVPDDDPVHYAQHQIRIIDCMAMMAGLNYNMDTPAINAVIAASNGHASTREIIRALAEGPLYYEPGTRFKYSLAHDVLAAVIEVVSGERYSTYLKKHIFEPVGAENLFFRPTAEQKARIAAIYDGDPRTEGFAPCNAGGRAPTDEYESGGGGMFGAAESYSKVLETMANNGLSVTGNRILSEKSVKMFMAGVTTGKAQEDFEKMDKGPYAYGLGVRVKNTAEIGKSPVGEFGWDGAAGAYAVIDPINHISITYVQHIMNFPGVYTEVHPMVRDLVYEGLEN